MNRPWVGLLSWAVVVGVTGCIDRASPMAAGGHAGGASGNLGPLGAAGAVGTSTGGAPGSNGWVAPDAGVGALPACDSGAGGVLAHCSGQSPWGAGGSPGGHAAAGGRGACDSRCRPAAPQPIEPIADPCAVILGPDADLLATVKIGRPEEERCAPEADDSSFVALTIGREALMVAGPTIAFPLGACTANAPRIEDRPPPPDRGSSDGYRIIVNPRLQYDVKVDDFERELTVAKVELFERGGQLESRFFFAAKSQGKARDLVISASVDGGPAAATPGFTVETIFIPHFVHRACKAVTLVSDERLAMLDIKSPDERRCHPRATNPSSVFLEGPGQAVRVPGSLIGFVQADCTTPLKVTPHLGGADGMDLAYEISDGSGVVFQLRGLRRDVLELAKVELFEKEGVLSSAFVLAGRGRGVVEAAFDVSSVVLPSFTTGSSLRIESVP